MPAGPSTAPVPLVIDFHHYGGTPLTQNQVDEMRAAAAERGMAVLQPDGVDGSWNAGKCCGAAYADDVDDVAFVAALLDEVGRGGCIDESRVYATGLSNGGMMAHRIGCELADRVRAVAPVAAPLHVTECTPARPVDVLTIHGTDDPSVPFSGGEGWQPLPLEGELDFMSADASLQRWLGLNQCSPQPQQVRRRGSVGCARYACAAGNVVERCAVEGGGHTWPGGDPTTVVPLGIFGEINDDLDATSYILDFFARDEGWAEWGSAARPGLFNR